MNGQEKNNSQNRPSASDEEYLIELLSRVGTVSDAMEKAKKLFDRFFTLTAILGTPCAQLKEAGLTEREAVMLSLLFPMVRRAELEKSAKTVFSDADTVGRFFVRLFAGQRTERVYLLALNEKMQLIRLVNVSDGSVNAASFQNRYVVEKAIAEKAVYAIVAHNHPSGEAEPSSTDIATTARLAGAFDVVGIPLLEHMVVADNRYTPILFYAPTLSVRAPESFYSSQLREQIAALI